METLANITPTDIHNGVLIRMLANAGIPDIQQYVNQFHHETEELIVEEFEHPGTRQTENDEQIVPPADIQRWISRFRPSLNESIPPSSPPEQEQKQQSPQDIQSWITGLRPRLDDPIVPSPALPQQQQQPNQKPPPTDLTSWMQQMAPNDSPSSTNHTSTTQTTITSTDSTPLSGNLGTWLHEWSKQLTEQPPPTSLDNWLQRLVPTNMHEPLSKANSPKGRLNSYLNAAQQVLSQHGYDVSSEVKPPTNIQTKTGMFGNVKQMYFLWKTLDKNNDRKITVEDVQIMLQEMGLGFLSKYVAQTLFDMVDTDHDGALQFRDFVALMGIIKQLLGTVGSAKA